MKVLTTLSLKDVDCLNNNESLNKSDLNNHINPNFRKEILKDLDKRTGLSEGLLMGISTIYYDRVNIEQHYREVGDFLQVKTNTIVLCLDLSEDEVLSLDYNDFINYNFEFNEYDEYTSELKYEDIKSKIHLGDSKNCNTVVLFTELNLRDCKSFMVINEDWGLSSYNIKGVREIKIDKIDFSRSVS